MRFFTGDTHFNHSLIANMRAFKGGMGFKSTQEHDEFIINTWNAYVKKGDEVWHLGDFCFGTHEIVRSIRARLNGKIHLIMGNHDYANRIMNIPGQFTSINDIKEIKLSHKGYPPIILCHYAMRVWSKSHYNSWHLFGHSHGRLIGLGKSYDVGLDNNQFRLLTERDIIDIIDKLPDNINLLKK
jgi:calcineurin-like phosphoesterase family protein